METDKTFYLNMEDYKLGRFVASLDTDSENIDVLIEYFDWCLLHKEYRSENFIIGIRLLNNDVVKIGYIAPDPNPLFDEIEINIYINDQLYMMKRFNNAIGVESYVIDTIKSDLKRIINLE